MCVIIVKKAGISVDVLDYATLAACWDSNPHGAGIMYARGKKVSIVKGLMTLEALIEAIDGANIQQSEPLVIHFRVATSGGVNRGMTHPFPLVPDVKKLRSTSITCGAALAHNGVLGSGSASLSDTALAVRDLFHHDLFLDGVRRKSKKVLDFIEYYTEGSRLVWLFGCGSLNFFGPWHERKGLLFSNLYWEKDWYFTDTREPEFFECVKCGAPLAGDNPGALCWTCYDAWGASGRDNCAVCGHKLDWSEDDEGPVCSVCLRYA